MEEILTEIAKNMKRIPFRNSNKFLISGEEVGDALQSAFKEGEKVYKEFIEQLKEERKSIFLEARKSKKTFSKDNLLTWLEGQLNQLDNKIKSEEGKKND